MVGRTLMALGVLIAPLSAAHAQFAPNPYNPFNPVIAGVPVYCTSYGTGQPVAFIPNPALQDVGRARPGTPPTIELNPLVLATLPQKMQLFWYGHECGHHVLGPYNSESNADCWSIQTGKQQGLFSPSDVQVMQQYMVNNPGSPWGHLPGPARAALLLACWDNSQGPPGG